MPLLPYSVLSVQPSASFPSVFHSALPPHQKSPHIFSCHIFLFLSQEKAPCLISRPYSSFLHKDQLTSLTHSHCSLFSLSHSLFRVFDYQFFHWFQPFFLVAFVQFSPANNNLTFLPIPWNKFPQSSFLLSNHHFHFPSKRTSIDHRLSNFICFSLLSALACYLHTPIFRC